MIKMYNIMLFGDPRLWRKRDFSNDVTSHNETGGHGQKSINLKVKQSACVSVLIFTIP